MRSDRGGTGQLDLLLLAGLAAAGEAHGYMLIGAVRDHSVGDLVLAEGSVYPALQRLERDGLVVGRWDDSASRPRRLYQLTTDGRAELAAKRAEWRRFSVGVNRVIAGAT